MKKSPTDTLIILCRLNTGNNTTDRKRVITSIAKTTIVYDKVSFNLNLCFYKSSDVLMKKAFAVPNFSKFKIIIKAPEDDVLIQIRRTEQQAGQDYKVKCQISLLDCDKIEILSSCDFSFFNFKSPEKKTWNFPPFLKKSLLIDLKLYDSCTLKVDFSATNFSSFSEFIEEVDNCPCQSSLNTSENPAIELLQDDLYAMLLDDKYADVRLRVGEDVISAHKALLATRSTVFAAMFNQDMIENQTGTIDISDISADTLKLFLKFLYTGKLAESDCETMVELLLAAEKYQVLSLKEKCSRYLSLHLDADNIYDVVSVADMVGHEVLKMAAIKYIKENAAKILGSPNWPKWSKKNAELGSEILCKLSENLKTVNLHSDA